MKEHILGAAAVLGLSVAPAAAATFDGYLLLDATISETEIIADNLPGVGGLLVLGGGGATGADYTGAATSDLVITITGIAETGQELSGTLPVVDSADPANSVLAGNLRTSINSVCAVALNVRRRFPGDWGAAECWR